jgi:HK97 family phage prohead protease
MKKEQAQKEQAHSIERRIYCFEARASSEAEKMTIGGKAADMGGYANMGWYLEKIETNAFDECDMADCAALFNHDNNLVLGRASNGTLKLKATDKGLEYEVEVAPTQTGRDVYELVKRGDINKSSFAFTVKNQRWESVKRSELAPVIDESVLDAVSYGGNVDIRVIEKIEKLYDVSPVTYPAYADTSVAKRSAQESGINPEKRHGDPENPTEDEFLKLVNMRRRLLVARKNSL